MLQLSTKRIELYVEEDNQQAFNFYKKLGFKVDAKIPMSFKREYQNHYVDEYLMSLT